MNPAFDPDDTAPANLAASWRREAEVLRSYGAADRADTAERHATEMERAFRDWGRQELPISEATDWSGYSAERLRELVREGKIPDGRPSGSQGKIQIRRCDLPRKPGQASEGIFASGGSAGESVPSRSQMARSVVDSD